LGSVRNGKLSPRESECPRKVSATTGRITELPRVPTCSFPVAGLASMMPPDVPVAQNVDGPVLRRNDLQFDDASVPPGYAKSGSISAGNYQVAFHGHFPHHVPEPRTILPPLESLQHFLQKAAVSRLPVFAHHLGHQIEIAGLQLYPTLGS
jgi:hypothetical protein